ncbi:MAG: PqqD family peptide modification chaperone [Pseudomonadota bacterium]|nr:PqqD family peptide modification chaperone [Pseudomonadota bacterium]
MNGAYLCAGDAGAAGELTTPVVPAAGVRCYLLHDEAILFSERAQRLYHLNTAATFIWCCCEERLAPAAIAGALAKAFDVAPAAALGDVAGIVDEWRRLGLLAGDNDAGPALAAGDDPVSLPAAPMPPPDGHHHCEHRYRLLDTCFRIRFPSARAAALGHPVLAHLEVPAATPAAVTVDITADGQRHHLFMAGVLADSTDSIEELGPLLHAHTMMAAYAATDCLIALHAGAVAAGDGCILLPGVSGSGKSTLTAALAGAGFGYLSDELAVVLRTTRQVRPAPVSIGLKAGSWPVLAGFYPAIGALTVHRRGDGRRVRYLPPPAVCGADQRVRCIVFPQYRPGSATVLSPVTPARALCRLTAAGYDMNGGLDAARVAGLVDWISGLACHELRFDSLTDAVARLRELAP